MCINLSSPQPVPATEQDVYCWKATLKVDENAFLFNHETLSVSSSPVSNGTQSEGGCLRLLW